MELGSGRMSRWHPAGDVGRRIASLRDGWTTDCFPKACVLPPWASAGDGPGGLVSLSLWQVGGGQVSAPEIQPEASWGRGMGREVA